MSISLNTIVTGMNGGPEAIMQNFNNVKNELERMNGSVVEIPKEQFTPINGFSVNADSCHCQIYKFNNFAITTIKATLKGVTIDAWKYKDAVSLPKSYFSGFSKFEYLKSTTQLTGDNLHFDANFGITDAYIGVYSGGNNINSKDLGLEIVGLLYK